MKLAKFKLNNIGSSLTMTLVILVILSVLGLAIISNTMDNTRATEKLSEYEKAFYCAETAVNDAVATVKEQASRQYMSMFNASVGDYYSYYNNFFLELENYIATSSASCIFMEPDIKEYPNSTTTQITMDPASSSWPVGYVPETVTINITSTAVVGSSSRTLHMDIQVSNPGIDFKKTSSPPISNYTVMLGGKLFPGAKNNSLVTVTGTSIIWDDIMDESKFICIEGVTEPRLDSDPTNDNPDDYINWHLDYSTFLQKLPDTQAAMIDPLLPGSDHPVTSTSGIWGDSTSTTTVSNEVIDVTGDIDITDCELTNCIIRATGNIIARGLTTNISGCQISAGGKIDIETLNIYNSCIKSEFSSSTENAITLKVGTSASPGSISICHINAANGNLLIESSGSSSSLQNIQDSNIYAGGSLRIGDDVGKAQDIDVGNIRDCFVVSEGNMTLATIVMNSSSRGKCLARSKQGSVMLNNLETDNCLIYAYDTLTLDSLGFDKLDVRASEENIFVAGQQITVLNAKIADSYFFSGDYLSLELNGNPNNLEGTRDEYSSFIDDSLIYAENTIYYKSGFSARRDCITGTLIYTNGDFVYHGKGSDLSALQGDADFAAQIVARGNLTYDPEENYPDRLYVGVPPESGDNQTVIFDRIWEIFGPGGIAPDGTEVFSLNLYDLGFEQELPPEEWEKFMPAYPEVFISEDIYE